MTGVAVFLFLVYLGGWLLQNILFALRSGRANAAGRYYWRKKQAAMFWLTVLAQLFFALSSFYAAYRLIIRSMQ